MSTVPVQQDKLEPFYPSSDDLPMADNSEQFDWIRMLADNLEALFEEQPDAWVGGNLFWYPVEGEPGIVNAPDVFVVLGRPKGRRDSYQQWKEGDVPMTVVFEYRSPSDSDHKMADKLAFYDEHGVSEYYLYNPETHKLHAYLRGLEVLVLTRVTREFVSPLLKIRFEMTDEELLVYRPDGERFLPYKELATRRREAEAARQQADEARQQAVKARQQADEARQQADEARQQADKARQQADKARQQADEARQQADEARQQAEERNLRLEVQLRRLKDLSRKARLGQASPEELLELDRLEQANGA